MEPEVYCTECGWEGFTTDLNNYNECPNCNKEKCIEDIEQIPESAMSVRG
jgi:predicted Zn-ribbon and HTH transcriptional regulator